MEILLIIFSIIALGVGFLFLSEATMGVGVIATAGVLAIYYRLAQATIHHNEIKHLLGEEDTTLESPPTLSDLARMKKEKEEKQTESK